MAIVINVFFCWFQVAPQPFSWKVVVFYFKKRFLEHFKIRIESKSATSCPVSSDVIRISLLRWQEIQECWMHYWPIRLFQKFWKYTNVQTWNLIRKKKKSKIGRNLCTNQKLPIMKPSHLGSLFWSPKLKNKIIDRYNNILQL